MKSQLDLIHINSNYWCMSRTNILLDDALVAKGFEMTGLRTKRELVDLALKELVRKENQKSLLSLEGQYHWESDLDTVREGRFQR